MVETKHHNKLMAPHSKALNDFLSSLMEVLKTIANKIEKYVANHRIT